VDVDVPVDERHRSADGEVVWSWRAHAGAKLAQDDARTTVATSWFTGESAE
jgi:hypothetical protein